MCSEAPTSDSIHYCIIFVLHHIWGKKISNFNQKASWASDA